MEVKSISAGAFLPHYKDQTEGHEITRLSLPKEVIIPLTQHIGAPCEPLVSVGDEVSVGQKIGDSKEYISAPVHASVSGVVKAIEERPGAEAVEENSIVIETDFENSHPKWEVKNDPDQLEPSELLELLKDSGVVGMGGAAFPTYVNVNQSQPIDTLLLNGAECEPYLTCDHRQMVEMPDELIKGAEILMRIIGASMCYIGIEDNKPEAIELLSEKTREKGHIEVVPLASKYPQGYKSHLINAVTGRRVPRGARSAELGCIVRNVGTTIAVYEAVVYGKPLYERVVTVTGPAIPKPGNFLIRLGTPIHHALRECGLEDFSVLDGGKVVLGGPMTGTAQYSLNAPVIKNSTGLLAFPEKSVPRAEYFNCVRCGECVAHCPVYLYPNKLSIYAEVEMYDEAEEWDVMDCIECGLCVYQCPSQRPIVQFIKQVKPVIKKIQRSRK